MRCDAVDADANEWPWAGCSVPANASTSLRRLGTCDCDGKATLFVDGQALLRHASIPETAGGTISWVEGYAVTAAASSTTSKTTRSSVSSSSTTSAGVGATGSSGGAAAATGAAVAGGATSGGGSLSGGAKAGIAVGCVGAVLSVLAMAVMVFLHRRSRRRAEALAQAGGEAGGAGGNSSRPCEAAAEAEAIRTVDASGGVPPPAYSGFKTELPADEPAVAAKVGAASTTTPEMAESEFGGDRPMSMVSELSSNEGGGDRSRLGSPVYPAMASISELQG